MYGVNCENEPKPEVPSPAPLPRRSYAGYDSGHTSSEKPVNIPVPKVETSKVNGMTVPELASVVQLQSDLSKIAR